MRSTAVDPASVEFEEGGVRSGGGPASAASVRDQGPRRLGGERARLDGSVSAGVAGDRLTAPAKHQQGGMAGPAVIAGGRRPRSFREELEAAATLGCRGVSRTHVVKGGAANATATRVLGCRVDWLEVAWQVEASPAIRAELIERQAAADLGGSADLSVAGLTFQLKRSRRHNLVVFENADVRGAYDEKSVGGWTLTLAVRAVYLATHELSEAVALCHRIAHGLGTVIRERLRRVDLAADFSDFPLEKDDCERVHTRAHNRTTYISDAKDADGEEQHARLREHHNVALAVTGITVAPGNPLMARIYDKTAELALPGRAAKAEIEEARWRKAGWDGIGAVTRVEFQHRGEYLKEVGLRQPESELRLSVLAELMTQLDPLWQRDVQWLRLVDPQSATRKERCRLDSRWLAVTGTKFRHESAPIARSRRHRGGAPCAQVVGAALSHRAAQGKLVRPQWVSPLGEVLTVDEFVQRATDAECELRLRQEHARHVEAATQAASVAHVNSLIRRFGPKGAAIVFSNRVAALIARFSSADDEQFAREEIE